MNIQRFTATGFNPNSRCAEVVADDHGAWVLHDDIAELQRDAEMWRKHSPAIQQMLTALDALSPLVLTRLKLQDAAMNGANG